MVANTTRGITYPTGTDQVAPLHTVFATMATSIDTALGKIIFRPADLAALAAITGMLSGDIAIVAEGGALFEYNGTAWAQKTEAHFASATTRDTAYSKANGVYRVPSATVYRTDKDWWERYQAANTGFTPNRPAGWYPYAGNMPTFMATAQFVDVPSNGGNLLAALTETYDPLNQFAIGQDVTVNRNVTLPLIHGWWSISLFSRWGVSATGRRAASILLDSTTFSTAAAPISDDRTGTGGDGASTAFAPLLLAGGNVIRVSPYQNSGDSTMDYNGRLVISYMGPA